MATKEVEEANKKAATAIHKVVMKQESAPGGIIDTVTKALAKSAKAA